MARKMLRDNGSVAMDMFAMLGSDVIEQISKEPENVLNDPYIAQIKASKRKSKNAKLKAKREEKEIEELIEKITTKPNINPNEEDLFLSRENLQSSLKDRYATNVEIIKHLNKLDKIKQNSVSEKAKVLLGRYSGWGGLSEKFKDDSKSNETLKTILKADDYNSAKETVLTAFYTPLYIIKFMYKALKRMGFEKGKILDPSTGTGRFLGAMDKEMYYTSDITAIEPDNITNKIVNLLYKDVNIFHRGFEELNLKDNSFDLCISNIPFGSFKIYDEYDKELNDYKLNLHDYFFIKAIKKTRKGGIIAFMTSTATLDSNTKEAVRTRELINDSCNFLGAVRMPLNTFDDTKICTDIIFLQKTNNTNKMHDFLEVKLDEKNKVTMNEFFINNPNMFIGEPLMSTNQYGKEIMVAEYKGESVKDELNKLITFFKEEIYETPLDDSYMYEDKEIIDLDDATNYHNFIDIRKDEIIMHENRLYQRQFDKLVPLKYKGKRLDIFEHYIKVKDDLKNLIKIQIHNFNADEFMKLQNELNKSYDKFVKKYKNINNRSNKNILSKDIFYYNVAALEVFNYHTETFEKADIFTKRSLVKNNDIKPTNPVGAYTISYATKGKLDIDYICDLLKDTPYTRENIISELCDKNMIYYVPYKNDFVDKYELSSGKTKLELETQEKNLKELINMNFETEEEKSKQQYDIKHYKKNIELLLDNQPEYITDVHYNLGSTWIPLEYYKEFISSVLEIREDSVEINYSPSIGYGLRINTDILFIKKKEWGTDRRSPGNIILNTLQLKDITVYDTVKDGDKERQVKNIKETQIARNMQEKWKLEFKSFIRSNTEYHDNLIQIYNNIFNDFVEIEYPNILYNLAINPNVTPREHQLKGASRIISSEYNTLLAHSVGSGKTYTMIMAAQEMNRINAINGLPNKNLMCIPKSLCESGQFAREYLTIYPQANILATTPSDFTKANRRKILAKIVTCDYDAIIISHGMLNKIPLTKETTTQMINEDLDELNGMYDYYASMGDRTSIKRLQKSIKKLEAKLKKLNDMPYDDGAFYWEDLGITNLFIDEAHNFKNLDFPTRLQVAGLSNSNAEKSKDLYNKIRYMDTMNTNNKLIFASATPVSNSMCELYTLMRYLIPQELENQGLSCFDSWASTFGDIITNMEIDATGTNCKTRQRIRFYNIPELITTFRKSADIVDINEIEDIELPKLKNDKSTIVELEPTDNMEIKVLELLERVKEIEEGNVKPEEDNMLNIVNEGKLLVISPRLVGIDEDSIKVEAAVENLTRLYKEKDDTTHLVFCDYGAPGSKSKHAYCVYDEMKRKLIANGIEENHIAYIHDADTKEKRTKLIKDFNDGIVRILIGSTPKMGEGVNFQKHIASLHHISVPWRPSDIEQRVGRMIRQFNENKVVEEFRYVVKKSFDAYSWQLIEFKAKDIEKILKADKSIRSIDDISDDVMGFAEAKACACGDSRILEINKLDQEIRKLSFLAKSHDENKLSVHRKIKTNIATCERLRKQIPLLKEDIKTLACSIKNKDLIKLNDFEFNNNMDELKKAFGQIILNDRSGDLGTIYGLKMFYEKYDNRIYIGESNLLFKKFYKIPLKLIKDLFDIKNIVKELYSNNVALYNKLMKETESLKIKVTEPFEYASKLNECILNKKELEASLMLDNNIELSAS